MKLFRPISVCGRQDGETTVRYSCFEALDGAGFCVVGKDFIPDDVSEKQSRSDWDEWGSVSNSIPNEDFEFFPTLAQAIEDFDKDIAGDVEAAEKIDADVIVIAPDETTAEELRKIAMPKRKKKR